MATLPFAPAGPVLTAALASIALTGAVSVLALGPPVPPVVQIFPGALVALGSYAWVRRAQYDFMEQREIVLPQLGRRGRRRARANEYTATIVGFVIPASVVGIRSTTVARSST